MNSPKAVLISDIHFSVATLELATAALKQAMEKAILLDVPLIIAGDTLDSKAIIRGEVANRLIELFKTYNRRSRTYMLVGNHDLLNEKGTEHTLNFLKPYVQVIESWVYLPDLDIYAIPYMSNIEELKEILGKISEGSTIICHQGVMGAQMGHYAQDRTSLPKECFANFRTISGHYHQFQAIRCGRPQQGAVGLFSYIGNPYTLSFGEANDPQKGFQILQNDGHLWFVPTNLPQHIIADLTLDKFKEPDTWFNYLDVPPDSKWWVKLRGPKSELNKITKDEVSRTLGLNMNFKLDLIPEESDTTKEITRSVSAPDKMFDALIDKMPETEDQKKRLKELWREIVAS